MFYVAKDIHIRPFKPDEWEALKNMRLHALKSCPEVYCGTYEDSVSRDDQSWKDLTTSKEKCAFGLFDRERLIGITGVFTMENPEHCFMGMTFIAPKYRGQGLSQLLYKARIDWAAEKKHVKKIIISHRADNLPSKHAIIKHGFEYTGKEKILWPDGVEEIEHKYELDLETLRKP